MLSIYNNSLRVFSAIPLLILILSCASVTSLDDADIDSLHWTQKDNTPKTVVVLPFDNETDEKDLEILIRKSFYNNFSSKNYYDIELSEVDSALKTLEQTSSQTWRDLPPSSLGDFFHADFIIYGRVKEFQKYFMGIYSQISLKMGLKMVECKSGDVVWRKTIVKRSHEGGIPFSLFGIIPAALRSGFHMKQERTVDLISRANRELVAQIPNPPHPPVASFLIEIQVASFLEKEKALKTLSEFKGKGFNPRIEKVTLWDRLWHRIIVGPYYKLSEAEKDKDRIAQNSNFQPVFIHHYPDRTDKGN